MAPSNLPAAHVEQLDFSETVNVVVGDGDSKQHFLLHKNIICRHSKFFRAAFSGNFVEAEEKVVKLPEVDPTIFKIWTQWAYSGHFVLLSAGEQEAQDRILVQSIDRCGELYQVADVLGDTLCRNTVTDFLRYRFFIEMGPTVEMHKIAYESTPAGSKLQKLCVDSMLSSRPGTWLAEHRNDLPAAFFADLAIEWEQWSLYPSKFIEPRAAQKCKYHDHDEDVPSCA